MNEKFTSLRRGNAISKSFLSVNKTPKAKVEAEEEVLEKGKSFPIGTVKVYGGKEYVKVSDAKGLKWGDQWKLHKKGAAKPKPTAEVKADGDEGGGPVVGALNDVSRANEEPQVKFDTMFSYGMRDAADLAAWSGLPFSEVQNQLIAREAEIKAGNYTEEELQRIEEETRRRRLSLYAELANISVHDRWETYDKVLEHTIMGNFKSMMAYGSGGVGKTWNMHKAMEKFVVQRQTGEIISKVEFAKRFGDEAKYDSNAVRPKPENDWRELRQYDPTKGFGPKDYEFVVLGGSITPVMTYSGIYQHNNKIIVFDDIDKILKNKDGLDVIKGALDNEIKDISWGSANQPKDMMGNEVPKTFKFKGKAIFITNLTTEQLKTPELQPITQSRAEPVNLTMTKQETIEKLQSLVPVMEIKDSSGAVLPATAEDLQTALDYMIEFQDMIHPGYFNARKLAALTKLLVVVNKGNIKGFRKDAASSIELPSGNQLSVTDKLGVLTDEEQEFLDQSTQ